MHTIFYMTFIQVNSDALLILGNWLHSRLDFSSCNGKFMQNAIYWQVAKTNFPSSKNTIYYMPTGKISQTKFWFFYQLYFYVPTFKEIIGVVSHLQKQLMLWQWASKKM